MHKKFVILLAVIFFIGFVSACCVQQKAINIIDAKTAKGMDDKLMPKDVTSVFVHDTTMVYCWFKWNSAEDGAKITAKWFYVTDNIHIMDYTFSVLRKEGTGGVSLTMPAGKTLPTGLYRVELVSDGKALKSLSFKIQ